MNNDRFTTLDLGRHTAEYDHQLQELRLSWSGDQTFLSHDEVVALRDFLVGLDDEQKGTLMNYQQHTEQLVKTYGLLPLVLVIPLTLGFGTPFFTPTARFRRHARKLARQGWRIATNTPPYSGGWISPITIVYERTIP